MAQNELIWDEAGVRGSERERIRREWTEKYRAHITAGDQYFPYTPYSYIEWYGENGRVVLELEPPKVEIVGTVPGKEKTPAELLEAQKKREEAFTGFFEGMLVELSTRNRKHGGDGNVAGIVVG
jgi:hypothetical protein